MSTRLTEKRNRVFDIKGLSHVAIVVKDMKKTVDFYQGVLGFPLIKTAQLPYDMGQHFFFDMGDGSSSLAFFWFPNAPTVDTGVTTPRELLGTRSKDGFVTAVGSLNHISFNVDADRMPEYKRKLEAAGIEVSPISYHDDSSPTGYSVGRDKNTWLVSMYFKDPDGIQLEFSAFTRPLTEADVTYAPAEARETQLHLELRVRERA